MKEATGELNMTVLAVAAIALMSALFYLFIWPIIQTRITTSTCQAAYGNDFTAKKESDDTWKCCNEAGKCYAASDADTK